jgi:hypothetical protein
MEMMGGFFILALLWIWLSCAIMCGVVAKSKARSGLEWLIMGVLFGVFALIAIAGMPTKREEDQAWEPVETARAQRREGNPVPLAPMVVTAALVVGLLLFLGMQ